MKITKINRNIFILFMFILCAVFCALGLSACGKKGGGEGNSSDSDKIDDSIIVKQYNDNITYRLSYTSESECPGGNISASKLHPSMDFELDEVYYMVVDFTIASFNMSGWNDSFHASIKVYPSAVISATLAEAATGNFTEEQEGGGVNITTTYSIPNDRSAARSYRISVQFKIKDDGLNNIGLLFFGDGENEGSAAMADESFGRNVTLGLEYELSEDGTSFSVAGLGTATDNDIVIPAFYWGLPVNSICINAFNGCSALTSVLLPNGLTEIGESAFEACSGLTSIIFPDSMTEIGYAAFADCIGLTAIDIPDSVTVLDDAAFCGCKSAVSITIGNGVSTIGEATFALCEGVTDIVIGNHVTTIGYAAFEGCSALANITIPVGVTVIEDSAFSDCESLTSIVIPNSVTTISGFAFSSCRSLTSVTIPDSVTTIKFAAFIGCSALTSITIPNSVTKIDEFAFSSCKSLTSLTLPDSGIEIGNNAFSRCSALTSVTIPEGVRRIGYSAFEGCSSLKTVYWNAIQCETNSHKTQSFRFEPPLPGVVVGGSIGPIFDSCYALEEVIIGDAVNDIPDSVFERCFSLTSVQLSGAVTSIGEAAFSGCYSLTSITIPDSVTFIGSGAFRDCYRLTSVNFADRTGWKVSQSADTVSEISIDSDDLTDPSNAALLLTRNYSDYDWRRSDNSL